MSSRTARTPLERMRRRIALGAIRELMREWARCERKGMARQGAIVFHQLLGARTMAFRVDAIDDLDYARVCERTRRILDAIENKPRRQPKD